MHAPPMQIAHDLDALEKEVMQEGGMTSDDYLKFAAEESGNVANDGMFSIQVLAKALDVWGLQVIPLGHPDMKAVKSEPQSELAFICNLQVKNNKAGGLPHTRTQVRWPMRSQCAHHLPMHTSSQTSPLALFLAPSL